MPDIEELIKNIEDMPAMPNVIMKALNVARDDDSSIKALADIIRYDQTLITKVLTLVNSAYYGFPQQINSIDRALSLIGMIKAKNIIVTVAMKPMFTHHEDKELWEHSIRCAVGCEHLASHLKFMDSDEAFVIGFLHDIGKIIFNIKDARTNLKVKEMADNGGDIIEIERTFFGIDHAQIGALLAKKWGLPILLTNAIKYHHTPNLSSIPAACSLVYLMDKLVAENFSSENLDDEIIKNLNINIAEPRILRENIIQRSNILLQELAK